jgi:hypothetical protein
VDGTVSATDMAISSGTAGYMPYFNVNKQLKITGLYYDAANGRYGFGTGATVPSTVTAQNDGLTAPDNTKGILLYNSTAAQSAYTPISPAIRFRANVFETGGGASSIPADYRIYLNKVSIFGFLDNSGLMFDCNINSASPITLMYLQHKGLAGLFTSTPKAMWDIYDTTGLAGNAHMVCTGLGIAHGMTTYAPTTAFFQALNRTTGSGAAAGGVLLRGLSTSYADTTAFQIDAFAGNTDYTSVPVMIINSAKKSGTGVGALGATEILAQFQNNFVGKLTLYGNGNLTAVGALTATGAFGCNGMAAQTAYVLGAAAIDLPSVIVLANNLRTMAINMGAGVAA